MVEKMDLHELKIWVDGFVGALGNTAPDKTQWELLLRHINESRDQSTLDDVLVDVTIPKANTSNSTIPAKK
tara:strand:- start:391 stop:603 length:213 start_codon:yes stop_codon:yes gene_type:complete